VNVALVYQKTRKLPDLFWNLYVCRPVAAVFVDLLKDTRVTPNQVTISAVAVAAISAGMLIAWPGYVGLVVAIVVFEASYVLDCVDGMLARWRGIQSTPGHLLDFLMDEIKAFVMLAAVAVRLFRDRQDPRFLLLGIAGLVALASGIALTTFQRRPEIAKPAAAGAQAGSPSLVRRAVRLVESVGKFLIHYPSYILYAAVTGHIEYYFYPYLAVNALYALRAFASVVLRFGRA
jgi:phosphatidylglycerophosphate synthase